MHQQHLKSILLQLLLHSWLVLQDWQSFKYIRHVWCKAELPSACMKQCCRAHIQQAIALADSHGWSALCLCSFSSENFQ